MAQINHNRREDFLPSDTGISVIFHDDENDTLMEARNHCLKSADVLTLAAANVAMPISRQHTHASRRMIFNPLHPSSELPPENLIELRKVHAGLAHRRKIKKSTASARPSLAHTEQPVKQKPTGWKSAAFSIALTGCIAAIFTVQVNSNSTTVPAEPVASTATEIPAFDAIEDSGITARNFNEVESGIYQ
ncbi:MAG: hypothetical protein V3V12_08965 [Gammaproteobacteria bacterium]